MGGGSLMFGLNHEQSEGNFKYTNSYNMAERSVQEKIEYVVKSNRNVTVD